MKVFSRYFVPVLMSCLILSAQAASSDKSESDSAAADPSREERLDALLSETLPAEEYRDSKNCLRRTDYRKVDILSGEYLLFSRHNRYWLNKLKLPCPGLRRQFQVLTFSSTMSSICKGEMVYVSDRFDLDSGFNSSGRPYIYNGVCTLGAFETISPEQAALLKEVTP
ncbi:MAG: hypothetical protein ACC642_07220 [Pseudomonadales bacterium]